MSLQIESNKSEVCTDIKSSAGYTTSRSVPKTFHSSIAQAENSSQQTKGCWESLMAPIKRFFDWIAELFCGKKESKIEKSDLEFLDEKLQDPRSFLAEFVGDDKIPAGQKNTINIRDARGWTILMYFSFLFGRNNIKEIWPFCAVTLDSIKHLIAKGASVKTQDLHGNTIYHYNWIKPELAEVLYQSDYGPDFALNFREPINFYTPLHLAVMRNNAPLVKLFLTHFARVDLTDKMNYLPVHLIRSLEVAQVFAEDGRADLASQNAEGNTLLHILLSLFVNQIEIRSDLSPLIRFCMEHRYAPKHCSNHKGMTPSQMIASNDQLAQFRDLL